MLLDSKVLALMQNWSNVPDKTPIPNIVALPLPSEIVVDIPATPTTPTLPENELFDHPVPTTAGHEIEINVNPLTLPIKQEQEEKLVKMEVEESFDNTNNAVDIDIITPPVQIQDIEQKFALWSFKSIAENLVSSWADLKEVFKIPKKERVQQMKEHEREADKGSSPPPAISSTTSSYDRDGYAKKNTKMLTIMIFMAIILGDQSGAVIEILDEFPYWILLHCIIDSNSDK